MQVKSPKMLPKFGLAMDATFPIEKECLGASRFWREAFLDSASIQSGEFSSPRLRGNTSDMLRATLDVGRRSRGKTDFGGTCGHAAVCGMYQADATSASRHFVEQYSKALFGVVMSF